jgi:uncharacterized protein YcbX
MYVKELWRFPVKSMGGERLGQATVGEAGIVGDRLALVLDKRGRVMTSRGHPKLLSFKGTIGGDGQPLINGIPWTDPAALELVRAAMGPEVKLISAEGRQDRFDILPLTVLTDGAVNYLEIDSRRLRPNILVGGVEGLAERTWPGKRMRIGPLLIDMQRLRPRCVMTTWDPDTQEKDMSVLFRIAQEFEGTMALDCAVLEPGEIRLGDEVEVIW